MKQKKPKSKRSKQILSLLLIVAILVTGAFAFLSATDSKTNVFTVGKVNIKLHENFDTDLDGVAERDPESTVVTEEIVPGQTILKQPYVENTGKNEAWIFMTVGIPVASSAEIHGNNQISTTLADSNLSIDVTAYAIQDNYKNQKTSEEIWNAYFAEKNFFDNKESNNDDRFELFKINDISTDWKQLGTSYQSSNNKNYYVFALKNKLPAPSENLTNANSSALFQSVTLLETIGSPNNYKLSFPEGTTYKDTDSYSVCSSAPLVKFDSVTIDGAIIDENYYEISGIGNTLVTFTNKDMLTALTTSTHDIDVIASDGNADGVFSRKDINCEHEFDENHNCKKCEDKEPGFYDADDNLIVKWEDSGIDVTSNYDYLYKVVRNSDGSVKSSTPYGAHHYINETGSGYNALKRYPETRTVIVPNTVLTIGDAAFADCSNVKTIQISDATTSIGTGVFKKSSAETIKYGANVSVLSSSAFGSTNLTNIKVDPDNDNYCDDNGIVFTKDKSTLVEYPTGKPETEYAIPNYTKTIGTNAFVANSNVVNLIVPESVIEMQERCFESCYKLESVSLPNSIVSIPSYAFYNCKKLKSVIIPDSVKEIKQSSFANCISLQEAKIGKNVTTIEKKAFNGDNSLYTIYIPASLTKIGDYAFYNQGLSTVYYEGNETQKANINISSTGNSRLTASYVNWNYNVEY